MSDLRDSAVEFLKRNGLTVDSLDADAILNHFLDEMARGLTEGTGSLEMIPTFVSADHEVPMDQPVIVIDAGGTNLRVCTVTFHDGAAPSIDNFVKFPMPGIGREVSKQAFYDAVVERLSPMAHLSEHIGFCFSYPSEILPNRDGRLIRWTKEVQIPDLVNERVGQGLIDALAAAGHPGKKVVILNDTVACLLAGKVEGDLRECSEYVGFILGTGTNTAYVERNTAIEKRSDLPVGESMVINLESGNFAIDQRGPIDVAFDEKTANPGKQTFEKMISGAYLGPLCLAALHAFADEGRFSSQAEKAIREMDELTTIDMDNFLGNPYLTGNPVAGLSLTENDREYVLVLCGGIVRRAAFLTAINIAGTVIKSGRGTSPLHPVCVNVDGSTFYKTNNFPRWTLGFLDDLLLARGIHYLTVHVDNAPVLGAAIAALTHL